MHHTSLTLSLSLSYVSISDCALSRTSTHTHTDAPSHTYSHTYECARSRESLNHRHRRAPQNAHLLFSSMVYLTSLHSSSLMRLADLILFYFVRICVLLLLLLFSFSILFFFCALDDLKKFLFMRVWQAARSRTSMLHVHEAIYTFNKIKKKRKTTTSQRIQRRRFHIRTHT